MAATNLSQNPVPVPAQPIQNLTSSRISNFQRADDLGECVQGSLAGSPSPASAQFSARRAPGNRQLLCVQPRAIRACTRAFGRRPRLRIEARDIDPPAVLTRRGAEVDEHVTRFGSARLDVGARGQREERDGDNTGVRFDSRAEGLRTICPRARAGERYQSTAAPSPSAPSSNVRG